MHLVGRVRGVGPPAGDVAARRRDHRRTIGSPCCLRELEVALVVRGHGHDRAGAVAHQHVVGDPDRDLARRSPG